LRPERLGTRMEESTIPYVMTITARIVGTWHYSRSVDKQGVT
jgi:hypothetical protein